MSDERTQVIFGANITDLVTKLREANTATKEAVEEMNVTLHSLKESFTGLGEVFAAFTAAEMFAHMIEETAELASHLEVLSQKTGMAVDDLSRLRYAANLSHIGVDAIDTSVARLARSMQDAAKDGASPAAEAFAAMGIRVKDAEGNLRPMKDVLGDVAAKFATYEDGAAKTALAMDIFGRSGGEMVPLLNKGREGIEALGAEQDKLNATMTEGQVRVAVDYENSMKRLEAANRGVKTTISTALMPTIAALADAFTNTSGSSDLLTGTMEVVAGALRFLGTVAVGVKFIFQETYEAVRYLFEVAGTLLGGLASAWADFTNRDFAGAAASLKGIWAGVGQDTNETNDRMKQHADDAADSLKKLYGFADNTPDQDPGEERRKKAAPNLKPKDQKQQSDALAQAKAEWAERAATATEGKDALLVIEMDFWQDKMATADRRTKEGAKLYEAYQKQLLAATRRYNADEKREDEVYTQMDRDAQLAGLDIEKQAIEEKRALRSIDAKDAQALLIANANAAYEVKKAALNDELAMADGDLVKQAQIRAKLVTLDRAHTKEVAGIHKATTTEIQKQWESTFSTITNTVRKSFDGVIQGTQTLRDAMRNVFRNMTLDFIAGKLEEVKVHAAAELAKKNATLGSVATQVATVAWGSALMAADTIASALTSIAAWAATAAAASWAALAGIPYIGPVLAPAAAAAALVGVLALGSSIKSAAGGYDIPAGINPVTQLHAQEMVLPAHLANAVRDMASGGGSGGGGGNTYHIHAVDAQSFVALCKNNPDAIGHGVAGAVAMNHGAMTKALKTRGVG